MREALLVAAAALALALEYPAAAEGVRAGLGVCGEVIIPSLFPFFVLGSLAIELGLPERLAARLSPFMRRFFGVPGEGAAALLAGLLGGYPLGAAAAAALAGRGAVSREEAAKMLGFCNNTGPAFLVGAAGAGVFGSLRAGLALYCSHILAALATGVLLRGRPSPGRPPAAAPPPRPAEPGAFTRSVTGSVRNILNVCGFVVVFSALTAALDATGILPGLALRLSLLTGLEPGTTRALLIGSLELGGGVSALSGANPTAANMAAAAFMIGWGGLSVHLQTSAVTDGLPLRRHLAGKVASASLSCLFASLFSAFCV